MTFWRDFQGKVFMHNTNKALTFKHDEACTIFSTMNVCHLNVKREADNTFRIKRTLKWLYLRSAPWCTVTKCFVLTDMICTDLLWYPFAFGWVMISSSVLYNELLYAVQTNHTVQKFAFLLNQPFSVLGRLQNFFFLFCYSKCFFLLVLNNRVNILRETYSCNHKQKLRDLTT